MAHGATSRAEELPVCGRRTPGARPDARPAEHTNATSPTASSADSGARKPPDNNRTHSPLDKGASDRPLGGAIPVEHDLGLLLG